MRLVKVLSISVVVLFVLPMSLKASLVLCDHLITPARSGAEVADMASAGLLPVAEARLDAHVFVMSVPLSGSAGRFLTHSWIVYKRQGYSDWTRYEVLGFASRDSSGAFNGEWLDNQPSRNRFAPDGKWFGRTPEIIASMNGIAADKAIAKIEEAIETYPATAGHYRTWPGPNSNTFVATIIRAVPELGVTLPPTAVGKDFKKGVFLGRTDSRTGLELNLNGVLGIKLGRVEGVDVNLLTLVAGVELRPFGIKLPGVGFVELGNRQAVPAGREASRSYAAGS